jgi:hypothetical protein
MHADREAFELQRPACFDDELHELFPDACDRQLIQWLRHVLRAQQPTSSHGRMHDNLSGVRGSSACPAGGRPGGGRRSRRARKTEGDNH